MGWSPWCHIPSFVEIGPPVPVKKIIWAWRPSWSCDQDHLYKRSFALSKEAPHEIWLWLVKRFQRRRRLKIRTDDGPWVYYKLTLWAWRLGWAKNRKIIASKLELEWIILHVLLFFSSHLNIFEIKWRLILLSLFYFLSSLEPIFNKKKICN